MKTSKEDFELFEKTCKQVIKYFGLKGWDIEFTHDDVKGVRGNLWHSLEGRAITINLSKLWEKWYYSEKNILDTAFHEVAEGMLLGRLTLLAKARYVTESEIEEATHDVVHILQNTVFRDLCYKISKIEVD